MRLTGAYWSFTSLVAFLPHRLGRIDTYASLRVGGREQESNLPRIARRPQPGLKPARPTGAASPPPMIFSVLRRVGKLAQERRLIVRFEAATIKPNARVVDAADHRAGQRAQRASQLVQRMAADRHGGGWQEIDR